MYARLRGERQLHITLPSYIQKPFARNWYYTKMRVGGILWGRRPPAAGGGPVLRRRPARRAGRRPKPPSIQKVFDCKWH